MTLTAPATHGRTASHASSGAPSAMPMSRMRPVNGVQSTSTPTVST